MSDQYRTVEQAVVFPATRSTKFTDKAFTENVIANIIKTCSKYDSFIVDDRDKNGALITDSIFSNQPVLKLVIGGYYIEVPLSSLEDYDKYYSIKLDTLVEPSVDNESGFSGVREIESLTSGNSQCFVRCWTYQTDGEQEILPEPEDGEILLQVFDGSGYQRNSGDIINQFNYTVTKSGFYQLFVVQDEAPKNTNLLWINSANYYVMYVYHSTDWVPVGAVYKTTNQLQ